MTTPTGTILRYAEFQRAVLDLERAVDFYCGALGFECAQIESSRRARLTLGDDAIELHSVADRTSRVGAGRMEYAVNSVAFQHIAIVAADIDSVVDRLACFASVSISRGGAVRLPATSGGVTAYKFRDLDGQPLELISFPPGTGDPKWQRSRQRGARGVATLGIDHSAIGVGNVERSIDFYVGALGLRVASRQVNSGPAQELLDGAEGVEVDVVGLVPEVCATPHLELLGYRVPAPLPVPASAVSFTELGDRLLWVVDDLDAALARLTAAGQPQAQDRRASGAGRHEALVRDPDGHGLLLRQSA